MYHYLLSECRKDLYPYLVGIVESRDVGKLAIVIVETKNRNAWEIAEEIRVILGLRAKIVET
jgi:hypothetical protein